MYLLSNIHLMECTLITGKTGLTENKSCNLKGMLIIPTEMILLRTMLASLLYLPVRKAAKSEACGSWTVYENREQTKVISRK